MHTVEKIENCPRAVILASGPSLTKKQIAALRDSGERFLVIGINRAYLICDFVDIFYAADRDFIDIYRHEMPRDVPLFSIYRDCDDFPQREDVRYLHGIEGRGLAPSPSQLCLGQHSGHHAIQLAIHFGATDIIVLGMDMRTEPCREHFFGQYGIPRLDRQSNWSAWMPYMQQLASDAVAGGVNIINCSMESAVECFPKMRIEDALALRSEEPSATISRA